VYLYIEIWKPKAAWINLTPQQRQAKIAELITLAGQHPITGVVPFSFKPVGDVFLFDGVTERPVIIDSAVARPTGFRWAAAWMVPTRELIKQFEDRVESLGWWWEYFEQDNAWGLMDREATVADMINVPMPSPDKKDLGRLGRAEQDVHTVLKEVAEIKNIMNAILDRLKSGAK
jgi:hypothetical protein